MIRKEVTKLLEKIHQDKFLKIYESLPHLEKEIIGRQILHIDLSVLEKMLSQLKQPPSADQIFIPYQTSFTSRNEKMQEIGKKLLTDLRCGAIVVAGGQGSRLRFPGPKGCFPISLIKHKSLFQILAEKCIAASKRAGCHLPIAIMTSNENHAETYAFFIENKFFGLLPSQISFFLQPSLPALDFEGNLFLESEEKLAVAPNGNGAVFRAFAEEGILQRWKEKGIQMATFSQIDNPLSDPFDCELIGFHLYHDLDVSIKTVQRKSTDEKAGLLMKREDKKITIVEYSEISPSIKEMVDEQNRLLFSLINISNFGFSLSFIEHCAFLELPMHPSKKAIKMFDGEKTILPETPNGWKFEHFVFDAFPQAEKIEAIIYPRDQTYAPLKNFQGEDSIVSVQTALLASDKIAFENVTGVCVSKEQPPFELSSDFHYPTESLFKAWKGKPLPKTAYVSADLEVS